MRLAALLLVLTVLGPSVGSLVCDLACAEKHEQSTSTGSCHESAPTGSKATLEAGHRCHDVNPSTASLLPTAPQVELRAMPVAAAFTDQVLRASAIARIDGRSPDPPHAPPPLLIPLRV